MTDLNTATKTAKKESPPRLPNEVDLLRSRIAEIQKACAHQWQVVEPSCNLAESKTMNVYLIPHDRTLLIRFKLTCNLCSLEKDEHPTDICFKCLGPMIKGDLSSRKIYFGSDDGYYGARLYSCENCDNKIAADEWNQ